MATTMSAAELAHINLWKSRALLAHWEQLTYDEQMILYTEAGIDENQIVCLRDLAPEARQTFDSGKTMRDDHTFLVGFAATSK
jgi:hypothetical protein